MSMITPGTGKSQIGEVVASYPQYEAAQKAVSKLVESDVAARDIAIVGTGIRSVERVTGKLGYATAARSGAINGLFLGLVFAMISMLGQQDVPMAFFIGIMIVGVAVGMLLSLITYTAIRRRRDYASVLQVIADHYDVTVLPNSVHKAREVMRGEPRTAAPAPQQQAPRTNAPDLREPPRYGERITPAAPPVAPTETTPVPDEPQQVADPDPQPAPPVTVGVEGAPDAQEQLPSPEEQTTLPEQEESPAGAVPPPVIPGFDDTTTRAR